MQKTFTTQEIITMHLALEEFIAKDLDLTARSVWNLEDNVAALKEIVDKFEKHRTEILTPFQEKGAYENQTDNSVTVKAEFKDEFIEAIKRLDDFLAVENTIELKTIPREDLPEKLSVKDARAIKFMLED